MNELLLKAKEVKKVNRYRKSILNQHYKTIRYLRLVKKLKYKQISEFLNENGVKHTYGNLRMFIQLKGMSKKQKNPYKNKRNKQ